MTYLLLDREFRIIQEFADEYRHRFGAEATEDPDLCMNLTDNKGWGSWSAVSGKVPTLRTNGGLLWFPYYKRWMLAVEKLALQGVPVETKFAEAMRMKPLPVRDVHRASSLIGNSMNMIAVATFQGIALACVGAAPGTC